MKDGSTYRICDDCGARVEGVFICECKRIKLDHPCRQTCSGWKQGYESGYAISEKALIEAHSELLKHSHVPGVRQILLPIIEKAMNKLNDNA